MTVKLVDRIVNMRNCLSENPSLFRMYAKEEPEFREAFRAPSLGAPWNAGFKRMWKTDGFGKGKERMNEKKPQPAWRKKEDGRDRQQGQQQQRREPPQRGRRPSRDDRDRDFRQQQNPVPLFETRAPEMRPLEVVVRDGNVDQALRVLKTKMSKEGILSELKRKRHAEKPSERKRRKHREAMKRMRKSKGRRRRQDWWKHGSGEGRSKVVASEPVPMRQYDPAPEEPDPEAE
jgi:small subunit ribosomal protein S21